jgi:hypothetical protein
MIAGHDESWWQIEVIDVDSDGEIDLLRIRFINGDTMTWETGRQGLAEDWRVVR